MKRMIIESGIENMQLYIMKNQLLKIVLTVFLIVFSNFASAQQFEIRYEDSVLNDGDCIMYIPSESEINVGEIEIPLQVCNLSDSDFNCSFFSESFPRAMSVYYYYDGQHGEGRSPYMSSEWEIDSNECSPIRMWLWRFWGWMTGTEFLRITIHDMRHYNTSRKSIYIIPFDTTLHPISNFPPAPRPLFDSTLVYGTAPKLCMVTVQDGHNKLLWNKDEEISTYNIFRESVVAGEYEQVATIPYDSASVWVDATSRPNTRSYRYKINATTLIGNDFPLSREHKTMHLSINQGLGGRWNLQWTPYEGAEYTTYIIYRGTTADSLEQIDVMPADGNTSYTDETATDGNVYYQVGIVMANDCAPIETKSASISLSNIATNASTLDIPNIGADGICIYSESGRIVVNGTTDEVRIFDMTGRNIHNEALTAGVYMVKVGNHPARKVVVIR